MTRKTRSNIATFNKIKFSPTRIKATMPEAIKYPVQVPIEPALKPTLLNPENKL